MLCKIFIHHSQIPTALAGQPLKPGCEARSVYKEEVKVSLVRRCSAGRCIAPSNDQTEASFAVVREDYEASLVIGSVHVYLEGSHVHGASRPDTMDNM